MSHKDTHHQPAPLRQSHQPNTIVRMEADVHTAHSTYWPSPFRPQVQTLPVSAMASVWLWPHATDTILKSGLVDRMARTGTVT
jgi:hypothetical protein